MIVDFASLEPIPNSSALAAEQHNGRILNETLQSLLPGQTLYIHGTYHVMGGIVAHGLTNITIDLDGRLIFSKRTRRWPRSSRGRDGRSVLECIHLIEPNNITLTSRYPLPDGGGVLDGSGAAWWGLPFLGYVRNLEDRPRLLRITHGTNILLEHWLLLNSPYWSTLFEYVNGLVVRYVGILARRTSSESHSLLDLSAFNTDGLDVSGRNVLVHDCNIWTQDDIIAVKDGPIVDNDHHKDFNPNQPMRVSENMLFERINGTGLGLTIGSIGNWSAVRNISFVDCYLPRTYKGIYLKFNRKSKNASLIQDIRFENIVMDEPEQYPIWIGPAQQADSVNICEANPCSLCWPVVPGAECKGERNGTYSRILLKNVSINRPKQGAGIIMGSTDNPMQNVVFDGVRVNGGCAPLHYKGSIVASFPLLPNTVPVDVHIQGFQVMVIAGILLVAYLAKQAISWAVSRNFGGSSRVTSSSEQVASLTIGIGILICLPTIWFVYVTLEIRRADQYFVCDGADGIAKGDTYPVPKCFVDETTVETEQVPCPEPFWRDPLIGSAFYGLLLFCAIPVVHTYYSSADSTDTTPDEVMQLCRGPSDDTEDPGRLKTT